MTLSLLCLERAKAEEKSVCAPRERAEENGCVEKSLSIDVVVDAPRITHRVRVDELAVGPDAVLVT